MATRIGSSRKAKHIDIRHLFIQQLISHDIVRIIKIHANDNPADIFTKYVSTETLQRHLTSWTSSSATQLPLSNSSNSFTAACNTHAAACAYSTYISFVSQTMGSTIVDQPFAVTTPLSISTWYLIQFVCTIFGMNISNKPDQHDGVHDLNMSV